MCFKNTQEKLFQDTTIKICTTSLQMNAKRHALTRHYSHVNLLITTKSVIFVGCPIKTRMMFLLVVVVVFMIIMNLMIKQNLIAEITTGMMPKACEVATRACPRTSLPALLHTFVRQQHLCLTFAFTLALRPRRLVPSFTFTHSRNSHSQDP